MIILDTSFIVAYYNEIDENHSIARELIKDIVNFKFGQLHITDYIFSETVTVGLIRLKNLDRAVRIGNYLLKAAKLIEVQKVGFNEAWGVFKKQKDTDLSFTDCTTIAVMHDTKITNIATFDEDFKTIKGINCVGV